MPGGADQDARPDGERRAGERLGIFGGTFDPVHIGHLVAAVRAHEALRLDRVLLVVANLPWQKTESRPITPARDRLAVVEAAVEGVDRLEVSTIEIDPAGSATAPTRLPNCWPRMPPGACTSSWAPTWPPTSARGTGSRTCATR